MKICSHSLHMKIEVNSQRRKILLFVYTNPAVMTSYALGTIVGFTLQAKLVSSKHLTQVHLKISSRTLENLASHLMTKYTLEAQTVSHLSL